MGEHPSINNFLVPKSQEVADRLISDRSLGIVVLNMCQRVFKKICGQND